MLDVRIISTPGTNVNYFDMPEVGDEIEIHSHPYDHFGAVLKGAVLILGLGCELRPGDAPLLFRSGVAHGYRAIEPGTQAIAIVDTTQPTFDPEA